MVEVAVRVVARAPVQDGSPLPSLGGHGEKVGEALVKGCGVAHAVVVVVDVGGVVMLQAEQPEQPRRVPLQQRLFTRADGANMRDLDGARTGRGQGRTRTVVKFLRLLDIFMPWMCRWPETRQELGAAIRIGHTSRLGTFCTAAGAVFAHPHPP